MTKPSVSNATPQSRASSKLLLATKMGIMNRPDICELCDKKPDKVTVDGFAVQSIVGHHWRGYDFPLDVWWICRPCNSKMRGKHDGVFSKEQARFFLKHGQPEWIYQKVKDCPSVCMNLLEVEEKIRSALFGLTGEVLGSFCDVADFIAMYNQIELDVFSVINPYMESALNLRNEKPGWST